MPKLSFNTDRYSSEEEIYALVGEESSSPESNETLTSEQRVELENEDSQKHRDSWNGNPKIKTLIIMLLTGLGTIVLFLLSKFFFSPLEHNSNVIQASLPSPKNSDSEPLESSLTSNLEGEIKANKAMGSLEQDLQRKVQKKPSIRSSQQPQPQLVRREKKPSPKISSRPLPQKVATSSPPVKPVIQSQKSSFAPSKNANSTQKIETKPSHSMKDIEQINSLGVIRFSNHGIPKLPSTVQSSNSSDSSLKEQKRAFKPEKGKKALESNFLLPQTTLKEGEKLLAKVSVGTISYARTIIPLVLEGGKTLKLPIQLTQSLGDIPTGSYLIADVTYKNRVISANVTAVMINEQLRPIPSQRIVLLGKNNQPLMAVKHNSRRGGGLPFGAMILEGLGEVLESQNLPDFTSTISNGSSTITQISGDANVVSGFIEGALNPLREQIKRQAQISPSASFWYLPAETEVVLFVQMPFD